MQYQVAFKSWVRVAHERAAGRVAENVRNYSFTHKDMPKLLRLYARHFGRLLQLFTFTFSLNCCSGEKAESPSMEYNAVCTACTSNLEMRIVQLPSDYKHGRPCILVVSKKITQSSNQKSTQIHLHHKPKLWQQKVGFSSNWTLHSLKKLKYCTNSRDSAKLADQMH